MFMFFLESIPYQDGLSAFRTIAVQNAPLPRPAHYLNDFFGSLCFAIVQMSVEKLPCWTLDVFGC